MIDSETQQETTLSPTTISPEQALQQYRLLKHRHNKVEQRYNEVAAKLPDCRVRPASNTPESVSREIVWLTPSSAEPKVPVSTQTRCAICPPPDDPRALPPEVETLHSLLDIRATALDLEDSMRKLAPAIPDVQLPDREPSVDFTIYWSTYRRKPAIGELNWVRHDSSGNIGSQLCSFTSDNNPTCIYGKDVPLVALPSLGRLLTNAVPSYLHIEDLALHRPIDPDNPANLDQDQARTAVMHLANNLFVRCNDISFKNVDPDMLPVLEPLLAESLLEKYSLTLLKETAYIPLPRCLPKKTVIRGNLGGLGPDALSRFVTLFIQADWKVNTIELDLTDVDFSSLTLLKGTAKSLPKKAVVRGNIGRLGPDTLVQWAKVLSQVDWRESTLELEFDLTSDASMPDLSPLLSPLPTSVLKISCQTVVSSKQPPPQLFSVTVPSPPDSSRNRCVLQPVRLPPNLTWFHHRTYRRDKYSHSHDNGCLIATITAEAEDTTWLGDLIADRNLQQVELTTSAALKEGTAILRIPILPAVRFLKVSLPSNPLSAEAVRDLVSILNASKVILERLDLDVDLSQLVATASSAAPGKGVDEEASYHPHIHPDIVSLCDLLASVECLRTLRLRVAGSGDSAMVTTLGRAVPPGVVQLEVVLRNFGETENVVEAPEGESEEESEEEADEEKAEEQEAEEWDSPEWDAETEDTEKNNTPRCTLYSTFLSTLTTPFLRSLCLDSRDGDSQDLIPAITAFLCPTVSTGSPPDPPPVHHVGLGLKVDDDDLQLVDSDVLDPLEHATSLIHISPRPETPLPRPLHTHYSRYADGPPARWWPADHQEAAEQVRLEALGFLVAARMLFLLVAEKRPGLPREILVYIAELAADHDYLTGRQLAALEAYAADRTTLTSTPTTPSTLDTPPVWSASLSDTSHPTVLPGSHPVAWVDPFDEYEDPWISNVSVGWGAPPSRLEGLGTCWRTENEMIETKYEDESRNIEKERLLRKVQCWTA